MLVIHSIGKCSEREGRFFQNDNEKGAINFELEGYALTRFKTTSERSSCARA